MAALETLGTPGPARIALIGECMIELSHTAADRLAVGYAGDVFNTAAYLARSAPPGRADVQFVTIVGDDPYSDRMRAAWAAHGVGAELARVRPGGQAGLYLIRTDDHGERTFHYYRSQSAARGLFGPGHAAGIDAAVAASDLVHLSGITLSILGDAARERLLGVLDETRRRGGLVSFDGNYRPSGWSSPQAAARAMSAVLARTDIALPTLDDDRAVFGDDTPAHTVRRLRAAGVAEIVVKLGARGCVIAGPDATGGAGGPDGTDGVGGPSGAGRPGGAGWTGCTGWANEVEGVDEPGGAGGTVEVPAVPGVRVVDTTAAGDAFNGGYLAARLGGARPRGAAEAASRLAARVIGHRGALLPPADPLGADPAVVPATREG